MHEWRARISEDGRTFATDAAFVHIFRRDPAGGSEQIVGFDEQGWRVTENVGHGMIPRFPGFLFPREALESLAEQVKPGPSKAELARLEEALAVERVRIDRTLDAATSLPYRSDDHGSDRRVLVVLDRLGNQMDDIASRLARMERRQVLLEQAIDRNTVNDTITREALMADFTDLTAEVEANGDAVDSAVDEPTLEPAPEPEV